MTTYKLPVEGIISCKAFKNAFVIQLFHVLVMCLDQYEIIVLSICQHTESPFHNLRTKSEMRFSVS